MSIMGLLSPRKTIDFKFTPVKGETTGTVFNLKDGESKVVYDDLALNSVFSVTESANNDFDIMGIFFKPNKQDLVLQTSYYYQKWREYIKTQVEPIAERLLENSFAAFRTYNTETREIYRDHLEELISHKKEAIEKTKKNLSAEEMKVQSDIAWLQVLNEQVTAIEEDIPEDQQEESTLIETGANGAD